MNLFFAFYQCFLGLFALIHDALVNLGQRLAVLRFGQGADLLDDLLFPLGMIDRQVVGLLVGGHLATDLHPFGQQPGDLVVLAGKGHETYQIRKGKRYEMDERVLIREILEESKGNV